MKGGVGIPQLYYSGVEGDYNIMVIELLGPNMQEVLEFCHGSLCQATIISVAEQLIDRIEYFHSKNYIHRDIKPENFMISSKGRKDIVYIIDYGLSKRFIDPATNMHIPYKDKKQLTGTGNYASICKL